MSVNLIHGDCLEVLDCVETDSVDLVLCDPPYGTTRCKWDTVIPFEPMWEQLNRVAKKRAPFVFTATQPFTAMLVCSNIDAFKYTWVWDKITARGHLVAKKRPMAQHEDIVVFYRAAPTYNPKMKKRDKVAITSGEGRRTEIMGGEAYAAERKVYTHTYPKTILTFGMDKVNGHPTQKPVALMRYLVNTYTNEGDTVLDFAMGSGTTGAAAADTGRDFIGIESDPRWFAFARERIAGVVKFYAGVFG